MATSLDQALLYFVDLRIRVRGSPEACAIVDRCLRLLAEAKTADADKVLKLEAEVEVLREDLRRRFGRASKLKVH